MAVQRITKSSVDALKPGPRDQYIWDDRLKGFGVKITPAGGISYVVQYRPNGSRGNPRRTTIGKHGPLTPTQARDKAEETLRNLRLHDIDPIEEKRAKAKAKVDLAYPAYAKRFVDTYGKRNWSSHTQADNRRYLTAADEPPMQALGCMAMHEIQRSDIAAVFDLVPDDQPGRARNLWAALRKLLNWAVERGDIDRSPAEGFKGPKPVKPRDRVLDDREITLAWRAAHELDYPFGPFLRVLIATGQRRNEVAGMDWREVDRDSASWTIPGDKTKNGQPHFVPLNELAIAALDGIVGEDWPSSGLIFSTTGKTPISGFARAKRSLDEEMTKLNEDEPVNAWRLHDLRRTFATGMQRLGIRFEVTEAALNHISGARSGVAGVYQRHDWHNEKIVAMKAWSDALIRLGEGRKSKLGDDVNEGSNVVAINA
ncbi:tyrosine-type recombinase/integrase [Sphingomicrobium clamense]|uniref:Site-specific integrase n=1 Tax=Sphingomicrobium clamense TaxID=2851013 RepID=A0ABS6V7P1_9SPHN|nr:site-specific integrase [Sphingomicrobium sp. B8]MBW0145533.1 site-specific integrase [Sphingomicrobium sp. B8]